MSADTIGKVKTINGFEPDESGNINIEIPEEFSGSWNDLKDKPFYEESKVDIIVPETVGVCHCANGSIEYDNSAMVWDRDNVYTVLWDGNEYEATYTENIDFCMYEFMTNDGLHIIFTDIGAVYRMEGTGTFTVDETHTFAVYKKENIVHKLDAKYLPDGVGGSDTFIVHYNESGDKEGSFYIAESVEEVNKAITEGKVVMLQVNKNGNFANFAGKNGLDLYFVGFEGNAIDNMNFYLYHLYIDGCCLRTNI